MKSTTKPSTAKRGASIRPSSFVPDDYAPEGTYDDRHGVVLSGDTRHVIEFQGAPMRTTVWALEQGMRRFEDLPDVDRMHRARRALIVAGSVDVDRLENWRVSIRAGKRSVVRHVSIKTRKRLGDLARDLGLGAETMAGLCVMAGLFEVPTIPTPTHQRLARDLAGVLAELRDRVRLAERLADPSPLRRQPKRTTWKELTGTQSQGDVTT